MCIYIYILRIYVCIYIYIYICIWLYMCVCIRVCVCAHINHPFWHLVNQISPQQASGAQRCLTMEHGTLKCCRRHVFAGHQKEAKDCGEALQKCHGRKFSPLFLEKKKGHPMAPMQNDRNWWGKQFLGGDLHFRCLANLNPELNGFTNLYPPNSRVAWRQALPRRKACSAPSSTCGPISPAA